MSGSHDNPASILDVLWRHADARPDHPAFLFDDGDGPTARLTYGELAAAVRTLGGGLAAEGFGGKPIALLFGQGLDFVTAFLACLAAGSIAVPLAPIGRRRERVANLVPIIRDCAPGALLLDAGMAAQYGDIGPALAEIGVACRAFEDIARSDAPPASPGAQDLAVLQYTSGSTSTPKGVMISHGNIIANQRMIRQAFGHDERSDFVGWAPHFHDQGLFGNILQPLYLGATCVLTSPAIFVRRPLVWLELIDRYRAHTSGGPNFAYEMCVEQARAKGLPQLDLSCWKVAFNGAEPIRADSVLAFEETFAPLGFARGAFFPCFGLAESTVVTACGPRDKGPVLRDVDALALGEGRAVAPVDTDPALRQICCGPPMEESEVLVVDAANGTVVAPGAVGEVWLAGPHIGHGYWHREDATEETFGARLADGRGPYLRTGDLGFLMPEGLYIVGRIKDLIIVRGRNTAPSDVEQIWTDVVGHAGQATAAAFQIERDGVSHVVLAGEIDRAARHGDDLEGRIQALAQQVRKLAVERLDLSVTDLVVVAPSGIPRTTSGKVRRSTTRLMLEDGTLPVVGVAGPLAKRHETAG